MHSLSFLFSGYYPASETEEYTEDFPPSSADTLTVLCKDWENSAKLPDNCTTRLVTLRIGVVLGRSGGVIQQTIWPFWFGLGGTMYGSTLLGELRSFQPKVDSPDRVLPRLKSIRLLANIQHSTTW